MSVISLVNYVDADDQIKMAFEGEIQRSGNITHMKRTLLHDIVAYEAYRVWYPLWESLLTFINKKEATYFAYAISAENECLLCSTYFRKAISDLGENVENLKFTSKEQLLIDFARAIVNDVNDISEDIYKLLRSTFNERQIVVLTAFAGQMIATNIFNSTLKIPLDDNLIPYKEAT